MDTILFDNQYRMSNNSNNNNHQPQQHRNTTNMVGVEIVNNHCTCRVDKKTQTYPLKKHSWSRRLLSSLRRRSRPNISFNNSPRQDSEEEGCPVMEKVPKAVRIIMILIVGNYNAVIILNYPFTVIERVHSFSAGNKICFDI